MNAKADYAPLELGSAARPTTMPAIVLSAGALEAPHAVLLGVLVPVEFVGPAQQFGVTDAEPAARRCAYSGCFRVSST